MLNLKRNEIEYLIFLLCGGGNFVISKYYEVSVTDLVRKLEEEKNAKSKA